MELETSLLFDDCYGYLNNKDEKYVILLVIIICVKHFVKYSIQIVYTFYFGNHLYKRCANTLLAKNPSSNTI